MARKLGPIMVNAGAKGSLALTIIIVLADRRPRKFVKTSVNVYVARVSVVLKIMAG